MTTALPVVQFTEAELESMLDAAHREIDRRIDARYVVFAGVTLRDKKDSSVAIDAYSRELSANGIGLLHAVPLECGGCFEMEIRVEPSRVLKTGCVAWCRPVGDGWFVSGWVFV